MPIPRGWTRAIPTSRRAATRPATSSCRRACARTTRTTRPTPTTRTSTRSRSTSRPADAKSPLAGPGDPRPASEISRGEHPCARKQSVKTLLASVLVALAVCAPASASAVTFHTVAEGDGAASTIDSKQNLTLRTKSSWRKLWKQVGVPGSPPHVDFSKQMLIAVTQGREPSGGHAIRVTRVDRVGSGLLVTVVETKPGEGCFTPSLITSPYHVVRVPKTPAKVRF